MSFTVRGLRNGSLVHVIWSDGVVTGDPPTCDLLEVESIVASGGKRDPLMAELYADAPAGFYDDPLGTPEAAYFLIARALDNVREVTGDVPSNAATGATRRRSTT